MFGFQRVGLTVQLLKCPIRILVLCDKTHGESLASNSEIIPRSPADHTTSEPDSKSPGFTNNNPFVSNTDLEGSSGDTVSVQRLPGIKFAQESIRARAQRAPKENEKFYFVN